MLKCHEPIGIKLKKVQLTIDSGDELSKIQCKER